MAAERREYLAGRIDDGPRERPKPMKVKDASVRGRIPGKVRRVRGQRLDSPSFSTLLLSRQCPARCLRRSSANCRLKRAYTARRHGDHSRLEGRLIVPPNVGRTV